MRMILPMVVVATLVVAPASQVLVLRSGERIEVLGELKKDGDRVVFKARSGTLYSLPASDIDEKATLAAAAATPRKDARAPLPKRLKGDAATKKRLLSELSKSRGTPSPAAPAPAVSASKPSAVDEAAKEEALAAEEETWRRNARALDNQVADAEQRIRDLTERERALNDGILSMLAMGHPQEHLGLQVRELQDTQSYLEQAKRELERVTRERAAFQDDARRRGILPGWLR
jgi:hypothetical protein